MSLVQIGVSLGLRIKIDKATLEGDVGHFARILVKTDLAKSLLDSLIIERNGIRFFIAIEYENLSIYIYTHIFVLILIQLVICFQIAIESSS